MRNLKEDEKHLFREAMENGKANRLHELRTDPRERRFRHTVSKNKYQALFEPILDP